MILTASTICICFSFLLAHINHFIGNHVDPYAQTSTGYTLSTFTSTYLPYYDAIFSTIYNVHRDFLSG